MIRIIIGNYLLISIALAMHLGFDFYHLIFQGKFELSFLKNQEKLINDILNNKEMIILGIYLLSLILVFTKSKISIGVSENKIIKYLLGIIFAPLTVVSIIIGLSVVIYGSDIFNTETMIALIETFEKNSFMYHLLTFTPILIILPAITALIFSTQLNFNRRQKKIQKEQVEESDGESSDESGDE
ncbi:hypothetical protein VAMP_106108n27 [Candidatus Vampirococcus lugosii]|uniref:Uncharacterized protein n=2 Tax=Candidatus Vampirococcus lugosii TaxID=2789015 RepID=A0ABS5QND6_9BACT|nr:hypothetical protein [Candidatus Vampirococcus lugosii]